jgi:hypothetical protein
MRNEQMVWNKIRLTAEIVDLGVGQTGKTVNATLYRISDGKWLQSGGGWNTSPSTLTLTAVDGTNLPGLYAFAISSGDHDYDAGLDGYLAKISESTYTLLEYVMITTLTKRNDIRDLDLSTPSALTDNTLGELIGRIAGIRQHNLRVIPTAWTDRTPTAGKVYLYDSAAALAADTGPSYSGAYGSYTFATTLDGSGNVTEYTSSKTT